jgi:GPH family glycoside/pentoside/hexuronide:cation symporter
MPRNPSVGVQARAPYEINLYHRIAYGLGTVGITVVSAPVAFLFLYYLTEVVGLSPGLAGTAIALPKLWDALFDPLFGGWVDRLALRMGRRGPIAALSGAGYLVSFVVLFSLPQLHSQLSQFLLTVLFLITFSVTQTGFSVSQYSLAAEMTETPFHLSGLISLANVLGQLFSVASFALAPLVVAAAGGGRRGYFHLALDTAVFAGVAMFIFVVKTHSVPVRAERGESAEIPLIRAIRSTGANRPFYLLIGFLLCQGIGSSILVSFLPFANQYVLAGHSASLSVMIVLVRATGLLGMAATPWAVGRFGDLGCLRWTNMLAACGLATLFAASFLPISATWMALGLIGLMVGANFVALQTAILEVAQLRLSGGAAIAIGVYYGIMVAATKIADSAGGFVGGELLDAIGFVTGRGRQPAATIAWLRAGYSLVPMLLVLAGAAFLHFVELRQEPPAAEDREAQRNSI